MPKIVFELAIIQSAQGNRPVHHATTTPPKLCATCVIQITKACFLLLPIQFTKRSGKATSSADLDLFTKWELT